MSDSNAIENGKEFCGIQTTPRTEALPFRRKTSGKRPGGATAGVSNNGMEFCGIQTTPRPEALPFRRKTPKHVLQNGVL
jgi:hypothetical protein